MDCLTASAQVLNPDGSVDCTEPIQITAATGGISIVSNGDYDSYSLDRDPVMFYKESDKYTFWYKFIIKDDCELGFDIFPTEPDDIYNFFLYRHNGDNFCRGIIDKSIIPVRANLYKNNIAKSGTGLGGDSLDASKNKSMRESFYQQSHHSIIWAKAGEVYYLNVYHTLGEDCGHSLKLTVCSRTLQVKAAHKPCFIPQEPLPELYAGEDSPARGGIEIPVRVLSTPLEYPDLPMEVKNAPVSPSLPDNAPVMDYIELKTVVLETENQKPLFAEIKLTEKSSGKTELLQGSNSDGSLDVKLDKTKSYNLIFSALGYIDDSLALSGSDIDKIKDKPFQVKLKKVNAGTNIRLNNIYFHPNTYVFRKGAEKDLEKLLVFLKLNEHTKIEIQGHTNGSYYIKPGKQCSHLGDAWNFQGTSKKLSKYRAEAVKDYLVKDGIDAGRIFIKGIGGDKMVIGHPVTYEESLVNMRVEFLILEN